MSEVKYSRIKLGTGAFNNQTVESEWLVGTQYASSTAYNIGDLVLYNAIIYQSLVISNIGNEPDISPSQWSVYSLNDGGYFFQVPASGTGHGSDVGLWLMSDGILTSVTGQISYTALVDGQTSPGVALSYPAAVFPFATIEYTLVRGSGYGRQRAGLLRILNDGISMDSYTHEFSELGSDVQVEWSVMVIGGMVYLQYTTDAFEGVPIELSYILKGWTQ